MNFRILIYFLFILFCCKMVYSKEIQILNETIGQGIEVTNHSTVSVHYIGRLEDLTEFDNSYNRGQLFKFQIGTRQVIQGWETGLLGMKVGGKRTIFIPYQLAYGESGAGDLIPPKSNLIFEIQVFEILPPKYKELDSYQLKLAITDDNFKIIDIRLAEEIEKSGKIPTSFILPAFDKDGNFLQNFFARYQEIVEPNDKIVFVSQDGIISSILANGFVEQLNQPNIYHLKDGVKGLKEIEFVFEDFKN